MAVQWVPWSLKVEQQRVTIFYSECAFEQKCSKARTNTTTRSNDGRYSKIWRRPSFTRCTGNAALEVVEYEQFEQLYTLYGMDITFDHQNELT